MSASAAFSIEARDTLDTTLQAILFKLQAKKVGTNWQAKCPAHEDKSPSLSISRGDDGRILLFCHTGCAFDAIVNSLGYETTDLFPSKTVEPKYEIDQTYDYRDEQGALLFQAVRKKLVNPLECPDAKSKSFTQRVPNGNGWSYSLKDVRRVLYRLPELVDAGVTATVFIAEGEKDVERLRALGLVATCNPMGAGKWRHEYTKQLEGQSEVVILADNDKPGIEHANFVASTLKGLAKSVRVLMLPGLPDRGDVSDWLDAGNDVEALCVLADNQPDWTPPIVAQDEENKSSKTPRTAFIDMVMERAVLFHDSDNKPFASITVNGHVETYSIESQLFYLWVSGLHFREKGGTLTADAEKEVLRTLLAEAMYNGEERETSLRLAESGGHIYLDLADRDWQQMEITAEGWKVIASKDSPVRFVRRMAMKPLPIPETGGKLDDLRNYMNVGDDDTWTLIASWLMMTLHPSGPYPILSVCGEQGSAKTSACRMLRSLVDPNRADLRAAPKDERDMMIAATNSWILGYDNMSGITQELSDSLCRIATGAGFSTRTLHSNDEETIFSVKRPIITNGIADVKNFPDLLERTVAIYLRSISREKRRDEKELWTGFDIAKPRILGALLTAVSHALKQRESVKLKQLPRMADFALWVVAGEEGAGFAPGSFLKVYESNQLSSNENALDTSPAAEICEFMELLTSARWEGTSTALHKALTTMVINKGELIKDKFGFPKSPASLGTKLRRIAPNLRAFGIEVNCGYTNGGSKISLEKLHKNTP